MIHAFKLKPTPSLVFGADKIMELHSLAGRYGQRLLVVVGGSSFTSGPIWPLLEDSLAENQFTLALCRIDHEPSPDDIDRICAQYRAEDFDAVVAIGGGSALDAGKAIAAILAETGSVMDFLEGVGTQKPSGRKVPFIAVPTTSGTGSEATSNAVLSSIGTKGFKKSLRHDNYIPDIALIDPQLTISCSKALTVSCGMDTFSQLVEAYLSTNASPITDTLALEGLRAVIRSLPKAFADGTDLAARADLSYGSYLSGIVLTNAGLGTVHGFASSLGGYFPIPHGVVCGTLMAAANKLTLQHLLRGSQTEATAITLKKYATLGLLTGARTASDEKAALAFISYLETLTEQFQLPRLSDFGVTDYDFERIVAASSNKYNPLQFKEKQLREILMERL